jgi:mannose/fructose/N-acetylgalactosamine-specific phosphotransferase system component IIB
VGNAFVRIDERLVHGQVLIKWIKVLQCKEVVIIDDGVYNDPIMTSVLKMSYPKDIGLSIHDVSTGNLTGTNLSENTLLLFKDLTTFNKVRESLRFHSVNIARLPFHPDKERLFENLYASQEEKAILMSLLDQGIDVFVQMVPDSEPIHLKDLPGVKNER